MAPTAQTLPYPCSTVAAHAICLDRVSSFPRFACGLERASVALSPASLEAKRLRFGRHRVAALPHPAVLRARRSRLARPRATAPEGRAGVGPATDSGSERASDARHPDGDPATRAPADEHGAARESMAGPLGPFVTSLSDHLRERRQHLLVQRRGDRPQGPTQRPPAWRRAQRDANRVRW